ncbi:MAG TPA: helix-turn-helix transcriptional regulator [Pseudaminobacter sp.]|nr:helix-turn-helix transcriptional regulator [Pseudaminobacter sp.]
MAHAMQLYLQYLDPPGGGERLVILPETQYRILALAAADALKAIGRQQPLAPYLPTAISQAISDGQNPVRAIRLWRGLSGSYLARLVGITPSMLSQIECTGKTGSTRTFKAIADALCVPVDLVIPQGCTAASARGTCSNSPPLDSRRAGS